MVAVVLSISVFVNVATSLCNILNFLIALVATFAPKGFHCGREFARAPFDAFIQSETIWASSHDLERSAIVDPCLKLSDWRNSSINPCVSKRLVVPGTDLQIAKTNSLI